MRHNRKKSRLFVEMNDGDKVPYIVFCYFGWVASISFVLGHITERIDNVGYLYGGNVRDDDALV